MEVKDIEKDYNYVPFPYTFQKAKPEEQAELDKYYNGIYQLVRVGPKGYVVYEPYKKDANNIYNLPLRPTDVYVASYQRSGTSCIFRYKPNRCIRQSCIRSKNIYAEIVKNTYIARSQPASESLAVMPTSTPRFIKTHLPMPLLKPKLVDTVKVVYVARNPKDVAVSCYHHSRLLKVKGFTNFRVLEYILQGYVFIVRHLHDKVVNLTLSSDSQLYHTVKDMEKDNNYVPFPYKFEKAKPEEQAELDKYYNGIYQLVRVGPKGYVVYEPYKKDADNIYNLPLRPTDVYVASYQRSGTTWTQELIWLLANDFDYTTASKVPLTERYQFLEHFMYFDLARADAFVKAVCETNMDPEMVKNTYIACSQPASERLAVMPTSTPRFIKTHLPMSLLNPKLVDTVKVVYVARNPKDVAVSCYHHSRLFKVMGFTNFRDFWNIFYKDMFTMMPYFDHVKEAWDLRHHPNMLFLFYEELLQDLPAVVRRVADFLGKEVNDDQMDRLCDYLSLENFRNNPAVNFSDFREQGLLAANENFIRKGKAGGWRDYFDEEMTQQAEQWIQDNLKDTDLRFPEKGN